MGGRRRGQRFRVDPTARTAENNLPPGTDLRDLTRQLKRLISYTSRDTAFIPRRNGQPPARRPCVGEIGAPLSRALAVL